MATVRDVSFTGSSKLYGTTSFQGAPASPVPAQQSSSSGSPVSFKVLVTENSRLRRNPAGSSMSKYEHLVPSKSPSRMGASKLAPVGLGHDLKQVIANSPGRLSDSASPEERRHVARLQVLQRENEQAQNALSAINSTRRAAARREREDLQENGTLGNLLPKWYSHESPVKHPLPQTVAATEARFHGEPAALTDHESFESILALAKAQESGSLEDLPAVPDAPAPIPPSVALEGGGHLTLQDAAEDDVPPEDEEAPPLQPDEFLGFIQQHGWVRKDQLEEMRQTKQQAAQRLRDIHSGADGMSLANHAANAGSIAGGASSPAMRASLQRSAVQGPQSPLRVKPGTALAVVEAGSPSGSTAAIKAEQNTLPTHRPLSALLVASVVGLATTTHIPLTAPPRVPHQAGEVLNALADKPNASELDAWLAVQTWALQCTQDELLSVRRKLVAAYREATPEGVTFETGDGVSVEQLHAAATTAADDAVTAWQQGPKLPEIGMDAVASTILAGHRFVHELVRGRTEAGKGELRAVLQRYQHLMPELQARVQVKNEQHDKLQGETQEMARAVAQLRSAALAAGVPHPHDVASGRSGGKRSDPHSASPLALRSEEDVSPRKAYERAAADVAAQYVSATRRAKESTDGSAIVHAAQAARLTDGSADDKDSGEMQLEALATMLETLGPDGAAAAKEREMAAAQEAARAAVQARYKPLLEAAEHEGHSALDDLAIGAIGKKQALESGARDMARQAYNAKRKALDAQIKALQVHAGELRHAIHRVESTAAGALELTVLKARVRQIWADVGLDMALPEVLERDASAGRQPSYLSPLPAPARNAVDQAVLAVARARGPQHEGAILRAEAAETGDASFQSFAKHVNSFLSAALLASCARPDLSGGIGAPPGGEGGEPGPSEHVARPLSFRYDSLLHDALAATKRRMTVSASRVEWQAVAAAEKALVVQQPGQHASADAVMERFHVRWPSRQLDVSGRHRGVAGHTVSLLLTARDAPLGSAPGSPRRAPLEAGASAAAHTSTAKDGSTAAALQSLDGSAPSDAVPAEWDGEHLRYFQRTWQSESWAALAKTFANSGTYRTLLEVAGDSSTLARSGAVVPRAKFGLGDTGGSQPGLQHIHDAYAYDMHRQRMLAHWK